MRNSEQKVNHDGSFAKRTGMPITARVADPSKHEGHLHVYFDPFPLYGNYLILDTDYESYTLVYECDTVLTKKFESGWVLTRKPLSAPEDQAELDRIAGIAKKVFEEQVPGLNWETTFVSTTQKEENGCSYSW